MIKSWVTRSTNWASWAPLFSPFFNLSQFSLVLISVSPKMHLATSKDIFGCHSWGGVGGYVTCIQWIDPRDVVKHPSMRRITSCNKYPAQSVHSSRVRKPCLELPTTVRSNHLIPQPLVPQLGLYSLQQSPPFNQRSTMTWSVYKKHCYFMTTAKEETLANQND